MMFPFMLRQLAAKRHFGNILATYFMDNGKAPETRQKARLRGWAFRFAGGPVLQRWSAYDNEAPAASFRGSRGFEAREASERPRRRLADCRITGARVSVG